MGLKVSYNPIRDDCSHPDAELRLTDIAFYTAGSRYEIAQANNTEHLALTKPQ